MILVAATASIAALWVFCLAAVLLCFHLIPIEDDMDPQPLLSIAETLEARSAHNDTLSAEEMLDLSVRIRDLAFQALPMGRSAHVVPLRRRFIAPPPGGDAA